MAPNSVSSMVEENVEHQVTEKPKHPTKIVWINIILFLYLHLSCLYGYYLAFTSASWRTAIFAWIYGNLGGVGITAGSHRLWTHRSYKAKWPLRALLCAFASIAAQNDIYEWSRDHRVHHKYTETDADPHNIKRGFFFAHMGWLMCKKHPDVMAKGKNIDLSDLLADPIVRFHKRFYIPMMIFFCFLVPTVLPNWLWGESYWNGYFVAAMARYCTGLNITWLVNSAAHYWGDKPFDKYIEARENRFVSFIGQGEGWHNYHHVFPWDYATSELGYTLNFTKLFIDFFGLLGWAYDMKTADHNLVKQRKLKMGDGTRLAEEDQECCVKLCKTS